MRLQETFVYSAIRLLTEIRQRRFIRKMVKAGTVSVVFQPVPISPKALSLLSGIGVPTYFGPLNGNIEYPPSFRQASTDSVAIALKIGRALSEPLHRLFPAKAQAAGLFVSNQRTFVALPRVTRNVPKFRSYDATIDAEHWRKVDQSASRDAAHFLYVGRLVDWKAVDIAVAAVHKLGGQARLTIVGNGPERQKLEALAASGPAIIEFKGYQSHDQLLSLYSRVSAQLLPSLREAGGNVCLEGLAAGIPVIATKWGGAMDIIRDGVDGILLEPIGRAELISGFAQSMAELIDNPARAREMGRLGRDRALAAFDWGEKTKDYLAVFESEFKVSESSTNLFDIHEVQAW